VRRNLDYRKLWLANLVSSFGSQITFLALPLTAVTWLAASPIQMGLLAACGTLPFLLLSLPAGVWVDRLPRRPVLIASDVGRALILGSLPLLAVFDLLRMETLYLAAFASGVFSLLYDITEEAYLPAVLDHDQLVAGNSQLAAIDSAAELAAPLIAGGLVQLLTAPIAIAVDAASFLWSAGWLSRIQKPEPLPQHRTGSSLWKEARQGLEFLIRHPLLRPPVLAGVQWQLFGGMLDALLILYLVEILHLPPLAVGLLYALGSFSALVVARFTQRAAQFFGPGPLIIRAGALLGAGWLVVALAGGSSWSAFALLAPGMLAAGAGNLLFNATSTALTQAATPSRLLGRVNASDRFFTSGALPVGALLGGWLGEVWGLRPAVILAGCGLLLGAAWLYWSPLRHLARMPDLAQEETLM
jgi:hypothetical protein